MYVSTIRNLFATLSTDFFFKFGTNVLSCNSFDSFVGQHYPFIFTSRSERFPRKDLVYEAQRSTFDDNAPI